MTKKGHPQNEHFTIKGHWWLPGSDCKVAGELCYTEEDMTLALYGGLNEAHVDSPLSATPDSMEFPVIHGESLAKVPVTVLGSFYTQWVPDIDTFAVRPGSRKAIRSSRLHCGSLLEGIHVSSPNERFAKCQVEIPDLEGWLDDSPFRVTNEDGRFEEITIAYSRPKDQDFTVTADTYVVRLIHLVRPPGLPLGNSPKIEHSTVIEIVPNEGLSVDRFADKAFEIVGLFAFLFGGSLLSCRITLHKSTPSDDKVSLYHPRHEAEMKPYGNKDFVIRYEHVKATFGEILENWLKAYEATKRARRMLLSSERRPSQFIELRFLPLVHAAEILSSEGKHSMILPKSEFKEIRQKLLGAIPDELPEELRTSITGSLGHANSPTLKRKLLGMLSDLEEDTCQLFCVDKESFIKGVVNTRNHFTHYSTKEGCKILQEKELHWATKKVSLMVRVLLLLKAGVPENILQNAIRSHLRLSQERRVWKSISEEGSEYRGRAT